ncbi:MAG: DUF4411 family protein [Planctomycetia bacterium]
MSENRLYLLDSNVFITAKNSYYAFSICPGFWDSLLHFHVNEGSVYSIDKVQQELLAGRPEEDLVQWVKSDLPDGFFLNTGRIDVMKAYSEIIDWANQNKQYIPAARSTFADEADGWLAAYARVHGHVVVTNEQPQPESKRRILLPDVCARFQIPYRNTFEMLKELGARYEWSKP